MNITEVTIDFTDISPLYTKLSSLCGRSRAQVYCGGQSGGRGREPGGRGGQGRPSGRAAG